MRVSTLYSVLGICFATQPKGIFGEYYGKFIGDVNTRAHSFSAKVYAVDDRKVRFKDFFYDGTGPAAYFWIGSGAQGPNNQTGKATTNEFDRLEKIKKRYDNDDIVITLPSQITHYGYIGIYCIQYDHNFGEVIVPASFELPAEQKLGELVGIKNDVKAAEVTLKDSATIELKEFYYDGKDPDVRFAVGAAKGASADQLEKLPDEQGRDTPLGPYSGKTVTILLPAGQNWNDYQWFTVYSFKDKMNLGDLEISKAIAESLPVHDPSAVVVPEQITSEPKPAPPVSPSVVVPEQITSQPKPPPATSPSTPQPQTPPGTPSHDERTPSSDPPKTEGESGFSMVIAIGVVVGIGVCIATSAFLIWFRSSDKPEAPGGGAGRSPGGAETGQTATGTGTSGA